MSLLLDTHIVLWWLSDDPTLAAEIKNRLDHEPDVYVSAATIWEVAIKQSMGKLKPDDLPERVRDSGFRRLDITAEHGIAAARLPLLHRDPFDRVLIAQALQHGLTIATVDADVAGYAVPLLSVV
jgi:PIN domain nuclease of toxin-antitoxin system